MSHRHDLLGAVAALGVLFAGCHNGEMAKSTFRRTPWGFQHCHGKVAAR